MARRLALTGKAAGSGQPTLLPWAFLTALTGLGSVALALSGGLDSRFLALAMRICGLDFITLHASGPHVPEQESREARDFAQRLGVEFRDVHFNPLDYPHVAANGRMRCYYCKLELMRALAGHAPGRSLCDGTNADDLGQYRPGLVALRDMGIVSPLAAAGLGKAQIRELGSLLGLDRPAQKARPCLLTRFAYDCPPSEESLRMLAKAEMELAKLEDCGLGLGDFRLRLLPQPCLQAEILDDRRRTMALDILLRAGFANPSFTQGSPSGYFDRLPASDPA